MSTGVFSRVIVPLDGSANAEAAIPVAAKLTGPDGEMILATVADQNLLHTFEDFANSEHIATRDAASRYLESRAVELTDGPEVSTMLDDDPDPAAGLVGLAERLDVDAIVMSSHGRTGVSRWLLGSVTEKVVRAAPCSVVVVRGGST